MSVSEKLELVKDRAEIEDEVDRLRAELKDMAHGRGDMSQESDAVSANGCFVDVDLTRIHSSLRS